MAMLNTLWQSVHFRLVIQLIILPATLTPEHFETHLPAYFAGHFSLEAPAETPVVARHGSEAATCPLPACRQLFGFSLANAHARRVVRHPGKPGASVHELWL